MNLDFHPQWAANGNQVTDTVSQFFEAVKDEWDGAIGVSTVFAQIDDLSDEAHACNDIITERSGEDYEPGSDAFGFASVNCITMQMLQRAADEIDPAEVNQATVIRAHRGAGRGPVERGAVRHHLRGQAQRWGLPLPRGLQRGGPGVRRPARRACRGRRLRMPEATGRGAAALAAPLIEEEARRESEQVVREEVVLPDDLLPGVGDEAMSLGQAVRAGGATTLVAVGFARLVDAMDNGALAVLAPDIQDTLGVSDAVLGAIGGAFGVLFLLGSIPLSTLADRHPRKLIADRLHERLGRRGVRSPGSSRARSGCSSLDSARASASPTPCPVNAPLLIDTYPIPARSRVFAAYGTFEIVGRVIAPIFAGSVAGLVAGPDELEVGVLRARPLSASRPPSAWPASRSPAAVATRCRRCWARSWREDTASSPSRSAWPSSACARSAASTSSSPAWRRSASPSSASRSS